MKSCSTYEPDASKRKNGQKDCGSLVVQKNPTCNSRHYGGGLQCCFHNQVMLDADQPDSKPGEELKYHLKFRFWYQEYKQKDAKDENSVPSHYDLPRLYFQTE